MCCQKRFINCVRVMTVVALVAGAGKVFGGPIRYTLNELPNGFQPTAMSANGDIVGSVSATQTSAIYHNGTLTPLNHIPSATWFGPDQATAINDSGQVGWESDGAVAMNNKGQIAGDQPGPSYQPYLQNSDGTRLAIPSPVLGVPVTPWAINDNGTIVGWMGASGGGHPFLYQDGHSIDLGLLPGTQGAGAYDVNNFGQVVGGGYGKSTHPFLWDSGRLYDLGTLGGEGGVARSINDHGQIVGGAETADSAHAFLYEAGHMFDLNELINPVDGLVLTGALAIDNQGDILAVDYRGGRSREYLLTPVATIVPEPGSLVIFASALAFLATTRLASRKRERGHS